LKDCSKNILFSHFIRCNSAKHWNQYLFMCFNKSVFHFRCIHRIKVHTFLQFAFDLNQTILINISQYFLYDFENTGKKTIVFDLDETLIHCNESTDIPADIVVPIKFPNNETVDVIYCSFVGMFLLTFFANIFCYKK